MVNIEIQDISNKILLWIFQNKIEIFGVSTLIGYLFFSIKQNILLWPLGLIGSLVYIYIYFSVRLYAEMGLQFYYVFISIYGWIYWKTEKENSIQKEQIPVKRTENKTAFYLFIFTIFLFLILGFILKNYTNASLPFWDAFTTSASISATWMLARKYLEHWIVWIIVDTISIVIYIYKDLQITAFLFLIYTGLAFWGYWEWKNSLKIIPQK